MLIHYNEENNFKELINKKVLVDFYANWCGPCKMLSPVLEQLSSEIDIDIVKIDVDNNSDLAKEYGIMSIPCLILFDEGKEIKRNLGFMTKDKIKEFIK
jgi:thioredoxin 1